jgi:hypothetical protein
MAKLRKRRDPMDSMIESALQPGRLIVWNQGFSFVSDLRHCEGEIAKVRASDPERSVALYLFCGWIAARQAAGADHSDTTRLLLKWMDHDDYGFCNDLELSAVKIFDRRGLEAFEREVRARFEKACAAMAGRKYPAGTWLQLCS